ncbi:MAG: DNA-binding protein WhiA [Ruminiclostridium sp.]|nr:DNA-binding protein WhiA [Ruminiclostridium sp.]
MSFSSTIKDELIRLPDEKACCGKAEIAGILRTGLMLRKNHDASSIIFITEHASLSRHIFSSIKGYIETGPNILGEKTTRFKKHVVYRLNFNKILSIEGFKQFLHSIGINANLDEGKIIYNDYEITDRCCMRAYIRGGFLAVGSITSPEKAYHLELSFANKKIALEYMSFMELFDLKPKHLTRKGYEIVYMKEGQDIVDFLNVIGAHQALMNMENVRILKDMRNQVNRIVNCETANLGKTVNASLKQVEYIKTIENTIGIENLPAGLKEIARLRLEFPEASLSELGSMLTPTLGKSGVNHRLRKLEKIAENKKQDFFGK